MGFYKNIRGSFANYKKMINEFTSKLKFISKRDRVRKIGEVNIYREDKHYRYNAHYKNDSIYLYKEEYNISTSKNTTEEELIKYESIKINLLQEFLIDRFDYIYSECTKDVNHISMYLDKTDDNDPSIYIGFLDKNTYWLSYITINISSVLEGERVYYIRQEYNKSFFPERKFDADEFDPKMLSVEKVI